MDLAAEEAVELLFRLWGKLITEQMMDFRLKSGSQRGGSGTVRQQGKVRVRMDLRPPAEEAVAKEVAVDGVVVELLGGRGRLGLGWTCSHWLKRQWPKKWQQPKKWRWMSWRWNC